MIARHVFELEADVKRAEVVILHAREEREQAEALLRSRAGHGVSDLVEKLRDAEQEIRLLQHRIRALEGTASTHSGGASDGNIVSRTHSMSNTPHTPVTDALRTLSAFDSKRVFQVWFCVCFSSACFVHQLCVSVVVACTVDQSLGGSVSRGAVTATGSGDGKSNCNQPTREGNGMSEGHWAHVP